MLSPTRLPRLVEKIRIDVLPCNDMTLNISAFKSLSDDRNGVDIYRLSTYFVAGLHNNHCWSNRENNHNPGGLNAGLSIGVN